MNQYPNDDQHETTTIEAVEKHENGWSIKRADGWSFFVPGDSPVTPEVGMEARFYGEGIGFPVRGLFLAGQKVFFRTPHEEFEFREIERYGKDAAEWLSRWDAGDSVWTIEMGGLGPGYEQCIHITCAELLRFMLEKKYDHSKWNDGDGEAWKRDREEIEAAGFKNPVIKGIGLSGAQWGAGFSLAAQLYMKGPREIMSDESIKDRHILVSKSWPKAA